MYTKSGTAVDLDGAAFWIFPKISRAAPSGSKVVPDQVQHQSQKGIFLRYKKPV